MHPISHIRVPHRPYVFTISLAAGYSRRQSTPPPITFTYSLHSSPPRPRLASLLSPQIALRISRQLICRKIAPPLQAFLPLPGVTGITHSPSRYLHIVIGNSTKLASAAQTAVKYLPQTTG